MVDFCRRSFCEKFYDVDFKHSMTYKIIPNNLMQIQMKLFGITQMVESSTNEHSKVNLYAFMELL